MRVPYQPWRPKNVIPNPVRFLNGVRNPLFLVFLANSGSLNPLETTGFRDDGCAFREGTALAVP
jgi:hypothetical protein